MGKGNTKKKKYTATKDENNLIISNMVDIQAEAYYRALKRIEQEKLQSNQRINNKKKKKWYIDLLLLLNVLFFPWKINKHFKINNQIYDNILVGFVSSGLQLLGTIVWVIGLLSFMVMIDKIKNIQEVIITFYIGIVSLFFGGIFIIAGDGFSKEQDSNKIYAYSAGILALISCVVSIISLVQNW